MRVRTDVESKADIFVLTFTVTNDFSKTSVSVVCFA